MTEPCRALRGLLEAVVREYRRILGRNLAGIYLHGSAAFGCFRWQTSDIDLLVAVHAPPSSRQKDVYKRQAPPHPCSGAEGPSPASRG